MSSNTHLISSCDGTLDDRLMFYSDHGKHICEAFGDKLIFYTDHSVDIYVALGEHADVLF